MRGARFLFHVAAQIIDHFIGVGAGSGQRGPGAVAILIQRSPGGVSPFHHIRLLFFAAA